MPALRPGYASGMPHAAALLRWVLILTASLCSLAARGIDAAAALRVIEGPLADARTDDAQIGIKVLGSAEGLPQLTVFALADAVDGRLYAGTQDGLARWDGRRFEKLPLPDTARDWVTHLLATPDGLYVGTDDHGLLWLDLTDPQALPILRPIPGADGRNLPSIEALAPVRGGAPDEIWVGTPLGLWRCAARACSLIAGTRDLQVSDLLHTAEGLWIGTNIGGLFLLALDGPAGAPQTRKLHLDKSSGLPNDAVRGLIEDRRGRLWIATGRGLARLDPRQNALTRWMRIDAQTPIGSVFGLRLLADDRVVAALWLNGLAEFRAGDDGFRVMGLAEGLPDAYLQTVHVSGDPQSPILWLGSSSSGVLRVEPGRWRSFDERHGLPQRVVVGVGGMRAPDGSGAAALWAGTLGGAVWRPAGGSQWLPLLPEPWRGRVVYDLLEDPYGRRWFGTDRGVLLDDHGRWREFDAEHDDLPASSVDLLDWVDGQLWLGTGHGLATLVPPTAAAASAWQVRRHYAGDPRFAGVAVRSWAPVPERPTERLLGTGDGLIHADARDERRIARLDPSCAGGRLVYDIEWVAPRRAWLATRAGVLQLDWPASGDPAQARCTALTHPQLTGLSVYEIAVDTRRVAWLFGYDGAREVVLDGAGAVQQVVSHGSTEGLPGLEFNRDAHVDRDGRLWVANAQGLVSYDPAAVATAPARPALALHAHWGSAPLPADSRLPAATEAELRFAPRLLSFRAEHRIRYQVQLEGLESTASDWLADGDRHYARLPPGSYRFVARARDAQGGVHGPVHWSFSVAAPWWQHPLAIGIAMLALLAAGLLAGRLRARALAQRAARLEALVLARTAELETASNTDPLTGAANRRCFQRESAGWLAATAPQGGAALGLLDLDHFKQINDRHGHSGGDAVLIEVARRLQALTPGVRLVRWGGEEFLLLLPAAPGPAALRRVAHAVLQTFAAPVIFADGRALHVRGSLGLTHAWPAPAEQSLSPPQLDALIARADTALYRAKQAGRDCAWAAHAGTPAGQWDFAALLSGVEARAERR